MLCPRAPRPSPSTPRPRRLSGPTSALPPCARGAHALLVSLQHSIQPWDWQRLAVTAGFDSRQSLSYSLPPCLSRSLALSPIPPLSFSPSSSFPPFLSSLPSLSLFLPFFSFPLPFSSSPLQPSPLPISSFPLLPFSLSLTLSHPPSLSPLLFYPYSTDQRSCS
jgi:hypothetical protein